MLRSRLTGLGAALAFSALAACATAPAETITATETAGTATAADSPADELDGPTPREIVEEYTAAFNARDVDKMESMMHPGIQWLALSASGMEMVSEGYFALVTQLHEYFDEQSAVTSELSDFIELDDYVGAVETTRWTDADGTERSQSALVTYQVTTDKLIRRVWYYPAVEAKQDR